MFKPAVKYAAKIRMNISGPSGSGKTYSALAIATGLAETGKIAVIDTERGSASKYADVFSFDVVELDNFHPQKYIEMIHAAESGYEVLVIDSLSHAWNGPGGLLEIVESVAKRSKSGNTFNAWSEATPLQNRLIDAITRCKIHVICTMRVKTEYVIEQNQHGKNVPRKVGLAPIQRADIEYEFDVSADMNHDHEMIIQKSRCPHLTDAVISHPGVEVANTLKSWLAGESPPPRIVTSTRLNEIYLQGKKSGYYGNANEFADFVAQCLHLDAPIDPKALTEDQARFIEGHLLNYKSTQKAG